MKRNTFIVILILIMTCMGYPEEKTRTISIYGYAKLDAVYESGSSSHGNFAMWAGNPGDNKNLFHLTANETRFGFNLGGLSVGTFKISGNIEVDFYGGGNAPETQAHNYLRHAYIKLSNGSFSIIAGQTADIISPYVASTLNYTVLWGCGNIGNRRPQLSVAQAFRSEKFVCLLQGGFFRNMIGDYDGDGISDGTAAGFPSLQGRISGQFLMNNASVTLGVSGHYEKGSGQSEYVSSSVNADLKITLGDRFSFTGEYFSGKNLGAYLGGILQNVYNGVEIETTGFFVNAVFNPSKKTALSLGYGVDDPDDNLLGSGMRNKNSSFFGNLVVNLGSGFKVGLEASHWRTDYKDGDMQKTTRVQNSWILSF